MYTSLRSLSGETLLAIGGAILFFCVGVFLFYTHLAIGDPTQGSIADTLQNDFERGQYFFNHDEDPSGPYDLVLAQYYFEKALKEAPTAEPLAWYQSGRIDFINGDFDTALEKFEKQIEYFDDQVPNVYYMIGLTYGYKARATGESADWEKAAEGFETFIAYASDSPWPRVDLAWTYFAQGKYEEMVPILREGLAHRPTNPWLLNMHGLALLNTGDISGAHSEFRKAHAEAMALTPADWGRSYPGNDPETWHLGLAEFRSLIEKNVELTKE